MDPHIGLNPIRAASPDGSNQQVEMESEEKNKIPEQIIGNPNVNFASQSKALKLCKTQIHDLPPDLKHEIFSRVPVKTLGRCSCVSKEWCELISQPQFTKLQNEHARRQPWLMMVDQSGGLGLDENALQMVSFSSASMDGELHYRFLNLLTGNVYLLSSGYGLMCLYNDGVFNIFNPGTREGIQIREVVHSTDELAAGFGYMSSRDEYKLVQLFDGVEDGALFDIGCWVLTLANRAGTFHSSWTMVRAKCPFILHGWGVLVDNAFYWLIMDEYNNTEQEIIVSLDLDSETFEVIPHPSAQSYIEGNDMHLMELEGYLTLVDTFSWPPVTDIWMLKDPKNKVWVKQYTINLNYLEGFDDELTQITPVGFLNGEIIIHSGQERLNFYNVETGIFRRGKNLGLSWDTSLSLFVDTFFTFKRPSSTRE